MGQARPSHDFSYVTTEIPEGMTIREWRRQRDPKPASSPNRRSQVHATVRAFVHTLVRRGGGARSGLAAKHGVLGGRQAPPFGSLRES